MVILKAWKLFNKWGIILNNQFKIFTQSKDNVGRPWENYYKTEWTALAYNLFPLYISLKKMYICKGYGNLQMLWYMILKNIY